MTLRAASSILLFSWAFLSAVGCGSRPPVDGGPDDVPTAAPTTPPAKILRGHRAPERAGERPRGSGDRLDGRRPRRDRRRRSRGHHVLARVRHPPAAQRRVLERDPQGRRRLRRCARCDPRRAALEPLRLHRPREERHDPLPDDPELRCARNNNEGVVNHDSGRGWTIEYNTIQNNEARGLFVGRRQRHPLQLPRATTASTASARYSPDGGERHVLDHNEIIRQQHRRLGNPQAAAAAAPAAGSSGTSAARRSRTTTSTTTRASACGPTPTTTTS